MFQSKFSVEPAEFCDSEQVFLEFVFLETPDLNRSGSLTARGSVGV